jgi:replicative DNA helicase
MEEDKVKIFDSLYQKVAYNKEKKLSGSVTSISPPFPRLSKKYPGWVKGTYTIITASSGIGKTKAAKFFTVTSVYQFIKANPSVKVKVLYFALEETKDMFWLSMISTLLYVNYNIKLSPQQLLSLGEFTLSDDILKAIQSVKAEIDDMEQYIEVIDNVFNPYGIYKTVRSKFDNPELGEYETIQTDKGVIKGKFNYKDEDQYFFVVTDQVNLLVPDKDSEFGEPQRNLHDAMSYFSKEYCLKQMCKRLSCVVINIQQQAADKERQEFYKGEVIDKKLEPSLDGLADNKLTQRDADLVWGIFAPTRYELSKYRGYNIDKLKDKYRCLIFLKDRHYGLANQYVHLYFDGGSNLFKELPISTDMSDTIYDNIINGGY